MNSKDKENKSVQDKLKQLFRLNKGNLGNLVRRGDYVLTAEIERELSADAPVSTRIKAIKSLCDTVSASKLEERGVEKIWLWTQDLLGKEQPSELRHAEYSLLIALVRGQHDRLGILRAHFFRIVKQYDHPEDIVPRFELLQALTDNGKDSLYFEEEVGAFLLNWLPVMTGTAKAIEFLGLLVNVIKFNASYVDEETTSILVQRICVLCCSTNHQQVVHACLQFLDTVVAYSSLPHESLPQFIGALGRTVNEAAYCQISWRIMRNLLGTHMGHSTLYTMCRILQEPNCRENSILLRGAVFFIKMALWDPQRLTNLRCPPSSVLPSILAAVKAGHPLVNFEAILGLQELILSTPGRQLMYSSSWTIVLEIIADIVNQIEAAPNQHNATVAVPLHEVLNSIENLIEKGDFNGDEAEFYNIIENCVHSRPESSVLYLIAHLAKNIVPKKHMWLTNLYNLLQKYFKPEMRTNIRLKVLNILSKTITLHRRQYEDELIDRIVIPHMVNIANDNDIDVRAAVAKLLIDVCMDCDSKKCLEVLDILEKLLNRPFEHADSKTQPFTDADITDIKTVAAGLIEVFVKKINRLPSMHAIRIYKILVNHLDLHYSKPKLFENCSEPRLMIFRSLLKLRADHEYHLGYPDSNGKMKYSAYLCVTYKGPDRGLVGSPPPPSPAVSQQPSCTVTHLSLRHSFKIVITCLRMEKDWEVLQLLLQEVPKVLQNKSFVLTKEGNNEVDLLVDALCALLTERTLSLPESLNTRVNKGDFHAIVLPVVASLATYHNYIDPPHQQKVIRCLVKYGSAMRSSSQCISALTICILEMRDVMVKLLPDTLLSLSKISATVYIAIPLLEFLSTLTQVPMVFANFVADQYMAVFAISLPYTNPFKYNHYTVSLAHHVIAVWFLKCRLPFRKEFVRFITNSLQTNALTPFEEPHLFKPDINKLNQDSSDRKRSSSLTEQSSRRRERTLTRPEGRPTFEFHRPVIDRTLITFYEELTETCIDLMARYTFSPCSASPKRLPTAEFLLGGGQSMTWLVGNRLIRVTTSGCSQIPLKSGLCDKCWNVCRVEREGGGGADREEGGGGGSSRASRQNSDEKSSNNTTASSPVEENKKLELVQVGGGAAAHAGEKQACACWCQGWAEIHVRRPIGDMSWVMRIQNQLTSLQAIYEFPLNEVSSLLMPSLSQAGCDYESSELVCRNEEIAQEEEYTGGSMPISIPGSPQNSPSRQNSRDSVDEDLEYDDSSKSRNPVRRSNSSPEMSANWKNPFLLQKQQERERERERDDAKNVEEDTSKKIKNYPKDARVSCEAIPEEIAGMGTTPPSNEPVQASVSQQQQQQQHPTLLSCHSYPGSSEPAIPAKPCKTVPPSPNVVQNPTKTPTIGALRGSKSDSSDSTSSEKQQHILTAKPPQSPTQTSPRLPRHASFKEKKGHEVQKSSSLVLDGKATTSMTLTVNVKGKEKKSEPQKRDRAYTISSMTSTRKPRSDGFRGANNRSKEPPKSGINPSFVFLQLFHSSFFGNSSEKPLVVDTSQVIQRSVKVLDCIPPYETHTIGVIYIRQGQAGNETEILRNCFGSQRYVDFLNSLGTVVKLQDVDAQVVFLGSLEQNGEDGKFAYVWQDDVIRVAFHVTTLMPNKESDVNCSNKKRHIGNNNVTIVYNESGEEYNINTIKSQFNFASVIIEPLDYHTNRVTVKTKEQLTPLLGETQPKIVSDQNVAILARQLALHANLASLVSISLTRKPQDPYASNWLERLRKIKNIRTKIEQESKKEKEQTGFGGEEPPTRPTRRGQLEDFTEYT